MNDIEVLEELRKELALYADGEKIKQGQALENLLKERQEYEKNIKKATEQYLIKNPGIAKYLNENYILRSSIKEKIEEYKAKTDCRYCNNSCDSYSVCKVLEELLKGE